MPGDSTKGILSVEESPTLPPFHLFTSSSSNRRPAGLDIGRPIPSRPMPTDGQFVTFSVTYGQPMDGPVASEKFTGGRSIVADDVSAKAASRGDEFVMRHDMVDQSQPVRLRRIEEISGQGHLDGPSNPDGLGEQDG